MSSTGKKRKFAGSADGNSDGYKYFRGNDDTEKSYSSGRLDPTFGQRSAFPGLDDYTGDEDMDYDDDYDAEALSYLRSVREEATSIPTLLTAPKSKLGDQSLYEDGVGDSRGWYSEGAYTAAPPSTTSSPSEMGEPGGRDPQLAFYDFLLSKYEALREQLAQKPPPEIQEKLNRTLHPTHESRTKKSEEQWTQLLQNTKPNPVQLALLQTWPVLRLLALIQDAILRRGVQISENTSLWLWGLLARVPDPGELTHEQVSYVRELGKKAVLVRLGFKEVQDWSEGLNVLEAEMQGGDDDEEAEDGEEKADDGIPLPLEDQDALMGDPSVENHEVLIKANVPEPELSEDAVVGVAAFTSQHSTGLESPSKPESAANETSTDDQLTKEPETEDLESAKARVMSNVSGAEQDPIAPKEDPSIPTENTRVALDMILTVAGEVYGQRDLLAFREKWDEESVGTY